MTTEEGAFCFPQRVESFEPEGGCWLFSIFHTPLPTLVCVTGFAFMEFSTLLVWVWVFQMHTFFTFKPRTCSQESHWLNTLLFPFIFSKYVFHNNSNSILVRVLHTSCCNNLIYSVCVLLMHRLRAWFFSKPFLRDTGYFHLLHHVGLQNCWHNPAGRGGWSLYLSLNPLAQQCHTSLLPPLLWWSLSLCPALCKRSWQKWPLAGQLHPAATPHCERGAESLMVFTTKLAFIQHVLFVRQCAKYYFITPTMKVIILNIQMKKLNVEM